jgi:cation-dependent mannose-6-phosphate receptor
MKFFSTVAAIAAFTTVLAEEKTAPPLKPCTIRSPSTGAFFDLSTLRLEPPAKDSKVAKGESVNSWPARGYDYGANFTLNICGPVVEELKDVQGVKSSLWKNVSAYYVKDKKTYSIGYGDLISVKTLV